MLCCCWFVWANHLLGALGLQIRSFFFFISLRHHWHPPLFLCSALDSFMGWADKAIWKHVTGLVGATLHKCEDWRSGATLEPAPTTERARTPRATRPLLQTFEKQKNLLHIELDRETNNYDHNGGFVLTRARWLSLLLCKICVGWMMRFWLGLTRGDKGRFCALGNIM